MNVQTIVVSPDIDRAAQNARSVKEIRELITNELRENSVYGLKIFDMQELVNGERFAGGSQTNVYKKQIFDGPMVAIKAFRVGFERQAMSTATRKMKIVKYFVRECGIWKGVSTHPNIVELFGLVESYGEGSLPALVSELYPLGSLRRLVNREDPRLTTYMRTKLLHDTCKGLSHVHHSGVVHRDIKGDNIFLKVVSGGLVAALGDFGSAKLEDSEQYRIEKSTSITTVEWAPPEYIIDGQLNYSNPTLEGDIWSFGCTILEILTGNNPWGGENTTALLHLQGRYGPSHPKRPESCVDENHWDIMTWCWEINATNRLKADSVALALEDILNTTM